MTTHPFKRFATAGAALCMALVSACTAGHAQSGGPVPPSAVPVLVLGDDSESESVKRSTGLYRDVSVALQTRFAQEGYRVVDAQAAGSRIGFDFPDRMKRTELFQLFRGLDRSGIASADVRILVLFRIYASVTQQSYGTRIQTRVVGELFDGEADRLINSFALPPDAFPGPVDCLDNVPACVDMTIRPRAGDIAAQLGDILADQLSAFSGSQTVSAAPPPAPPAAPPAAPPEDMIGAGSPLCAHPETTMTVELRNFPLAQANAVAAVMDGEFPCRVEIDLLPGSNNTVRRYRYVTVAKAAKIEEWMHILLGDMGYDTDGPVRVAYLADNVIRVDNILP